MYVIQTTFLFTVAIINNQGFVHLGCTENICTSDHSPVFATFDVGVLSQTLSSSDGEYLFSSNNI